MDRVSSQGTIFLRIALPTIWLATILSLVVLLAWAVRGKAQIFTNPIIWLVFLIILLTGFAFIHFVLWRVYRVDMDAQHVYVSNYFRTFKYRFSDVLEIRDSSVLPGRIFVIEFKSKGTFGKQVAFLASQRLWKDFLIENPHVFQNLFRKKEKVNNPDHQP